mmetsp:Transcript_88180/g.248116  ORF Transcript_88180/g.248116 Transcript_88180/m.248116 type:complete len:200 (-) Transcript_88180:23-622(-)
MTPQPWSSTELHAAPRRNSSRITGTLPYSAATRKASAPRSSRSASELTVAKSSLPAPSKSHATTSTLPPTAAQRRGVLPSSEQSASDPKPRSTSQASSSKEPPSAAHKTTPRPSWSVASAWAEALSNNCTPSRLPARQHSSNGVEPSCGDTKFADAPARSNADAVTRSACPQAWSSRASAVSSSTSIAREDTRTSTVYP